ncbi:uncharacterized protein N7506_007634 [Penicillium brevicompactum]|uniref:uncharacterized protein n=1 Tax=Penicillium brevicompactum TaxID=5074 RepID=UPI00253F9958|nr:uncharacterized protein N7506_007634 [Penicillium brevicompactum]KAJ5333851.1 hypothetical protein N7506_007634 [Penicillium brevicompactum]
MKTIMKLCGLFAMIGFSCAQRICTADDVVLSLSAVQYLADKMQLLVDTNNNNIDPSGPIYNNYLTQTNHLNQDLQCNANVTPTDQLNICDAYEHFSHSQLRFLHVADGLKFYQQNGNDDNAVKMHGYILAAEQSLVNYTSRIKEISPSCSARIDTAYKPLGAQLNSLKDAYPKAS